MAPTVLVGFAARPDFVDRLKERYAVIGPIDRITADKVPPEARDTRVLVTIGGYRTDAALIAALPRLELIALYGTGHEGVDHAAAAARGIRISNGADANATAVADFAMGLVLASALRLPQLDAVVRRGGWRSDVRTVPGLTGKRLGIYGLGAIGSRVASRASAFEMEIGYHNRAPKAGVPYRYFGALIDLAAWSDILVVTVRADAGNRHSVDRRVLEALGPAGHLVNVSRGIAVDEAALIEALEERTIAGAGLDVYEDEPRVPARLRALDNAVLSPHVAALSESAQSGLQALMLANLEAFFTGKPLVSPVKV